VSEVLEIIGFYFTLIAFISGLFFTRIDSWYGSVRSYYGKLNTYTKREEYITAGGEASGLSASAPTGSFVVVGGLVTALTVLAFFFPVTPSIVNPYIFLYSPLIITVVAYWIGGIVLLVQAKTLLSKAQQKIAKGISG
jgi:hypothetical protein